MLKGEIWRAKLQNPIASEPGYKRPILIIQSDHFNRSKIKTVICVTITKNLNIASSPGNVLLNKNDSNLNIKSVINISQIITLDKSFLLNCIGTVNKNILKKVDEGLKLVLEIN